jgi:uncharacterized protein (DUF302 family)
MVSVISYPHEVCRIAVDVGQEYEAFCHRYEAMVPELDRERLAKRVEEGAPWLQVIADTAATTSHGFLIFWKMEATELMALAGNAWRCVEYLMGNPAFAELMYRYDPSVLLYAPLRTVIYVGPEGRTRFAFDQPSTCFSSFADADIYRAGVEADQKMAALLASLDVPVGTLLDPED